MSAKFAVRRTIDVAMTAAIVFLLASQITGRRAHEWAGIAMTVCVLAHTIINRAWYRHLFSGRYRAVRIFQTAVGLVLLVCFAITAATGILMSQYAVPFLRVNRLVGKARELHLAFSHWSFVLIGFHLGLHWGMIMRRARRNKALWRSLSAAAMLTAGYGLLLSVRAQIYSYMFFRVQFAFFDYGKPPFPVFLENVLMLTSWAFIAYELTNILQKTNKKEAERKRIPMMMIAAEFAAAFVMSLIF